MSVPLLGPLRLSGFAHGWYFLYLLIVLALAAAYVVVQFAKHRRVLRFANLDLLAKVARP